MRRRRRPTVLALGVLVTLVLVSSAAAPASATATIRAKAGFSVGGGWLSRPAAELGRDLDAMQAARASWLRLAVSWANLEPAKGAYAWSADRPPAAVTNLQLVIRSAATKGIKVIAVVTSSPAWARPAGCASPACRPARISDYTSFLRAAVGRYAKAPWGVHRWEVWNMPNTEAFHQPAPDVARYAAMLKASYPVIHASDPWATVLLGGLGAGHQFCSTAATCVPPLAFLTGLYEAGAGGSFDGVDLHAVSEDASGRPISPLTPNGANVFANLPRYREVMVDHGDRGRIWAEISYSSLDGVTEAQQARYVSQAMQRWATYPWTSALVVYNFRDLPGELRGVVRQDGSHKPAYRTFASLTSQLRRK